MNSSKSQRLAGCYYAETLADETYYPPLEGERRCDVAIIGAGFTGLATSLLLAERGYKVIVLEAKRIGWGASGRNGGQVTGSLSGDQAMGKEFSKSLAKRSEVDDFIWHLRFSGHATILRFIQAYQIECGLKFGHMHAAYHKSHLHELQATYEQAIARGLGDVVELVDAKQAAELVGNDLYHGGLINRKNMHLHSLQLCMGEARALVAKGSQLYEDTCVLECNYDKSIDKMVLKSKDAKVVADYAILAGGAHHELEASKLRGLMICAQLGNTATEQIDEQILNKINPQDLAVYDTRFILDYYRISADQRIIFGGGINYSGRRVSDPAKEFAADFKKTFPALANIGFEYQWECIAGIVLNRIALLGKLGPKAYYAQGYSGHGIATSHVLAEVLACAVDGDLSRFDVLSKVGHLRMPLAKSLGQQFFALGMWYYRMLERIR